LPQPAKSLAQPGGALGGQGGLLQGHERGVLRDASGRVSLALLGRMKLPKGTHLFLSITHTRTHAAAVVAWEGQRRV
jgi:phosphopantetheinyl transferase (holo-ACP synthase)